MEAGRAARATDQRGLKSGMRCQFVGCQGVRAESVHTGGPGGVCLMQRMRNHIRVGWRELPSILVQQQGLLAWLLIT